MKLKIVRTETTNPYINLAAEEYLTFNVQDDEVVLYLWQNAHTVVIGKNQNPWKECNVERIKADKVFLARRMSGGGAVYHDMGNLNFTFIAKDDLYDVSKQTSVILEACKLLGINAEKTGRNDLTIDGKKFSGHAYYSSNGYNYHHGTVMVKVNPDDLPKYLNVSESKLKSKGIDSVKSRVTNLCEYMTEIPAEENSHDGATLGTVMTKSTPEMIRMMQDAMVRAAIQEYGCAAFETEMPEIPAELIEKYSAEEWRLGTKIQFEKCIEHRFSWGGVEIQLAMRGEYIENCAIYTDSLDTAAFAIIEERLPGCKYDAEEILGLRFPQETSQAAYEVLELIAASIE